MNVTGTLALAKMISRGEATRPEIWTAKEGRPMARLKINAEESSGLQPGTVWVPPREGSTWRELVDAFGSASHEVSRKSAIPGFDWRRRTNLLLTGAPITPYDRQRWESGSVE